MGEINVHITVINTHNFYFYSIFIYLFIFKSVKDGTHSFVKLLSQYHKQLIFCVVVLFYGVHEPFWFVILHINTQHTKLLGGMCSTVNL